MDALTQAQTRCSSSRRHLVLAMQPALPFLELGTVRKKNQVNAW